MASIQDERGYNQGFRPSPALTERTRRRADWIREALPGEAGARVLEIGCGTGDLARALAERSAGITVGLDLSPKFVATAQATHRLPNLEFRVADFAKDPIAERFDCVVGNGILHHLYAVIDETLEKISELLKPGGRMVFLEPNLENPYVFMIFSVGALRKAARLEPHEMAFSRRWIEGKMRAAGFSQARAEYRDFLLPNTPSPLVPAISAISGPLERVPLVKNWAQSLFITATKGRAH